MADVVLEDVVGGGRISFRGDSREPAAIFAAGFLSRRPDAAPATRGGGVFHIPIRAAHAAAYALRGVAVKDGKFDPSVMRNPPTTPLELTQTANRNQMGGLVGVAGQKYAALPKTGDFDLDTAVCVTARLTMAALFPLKTGRHDVETPDTTWIYIVFVRSLFNTHGRQVAEGLRAIRKEMNVRITTSLHDNAEPHLGGNEVLELWVRDGALWPLYAQELATKSIPPGDIIAAIKCRRTWKGDDWTYGASYNLGKSTVQWNQRCAVDAKYVDAVRAFIKDEPDRGDTPDRTSGFGKSTWR